ncbi:hypothetical protein J7384_17790 [Endozoicomonas sp. G2_1]|uniref:hypothetical protein n=1 Tax=Endozoicomonas sp. G2_1 TaxID=2821091 RepID=UPI001ADAADA1|nr:hypothetical protein [Endozoicomonas sp. G2_1]MBO9492218.1 hypothetical protein [Endozoicomonas sp. G2_1]
MATILATQLPYYKTTNGLGGAITSNKLTSAKLGDLFPHTTSDEARDGKTEYACIYIKNEHASELAQLVRNFIVSNTPSAGTVISIGAGTSAVNGVEQAISDINTAPSGVSFSTANGLANAINRPNLPAGQHMAIWVRKVTSPGTAGVSVDNAVIETRVDYVPD